MLAVTPAIDIHLKSLAEVKSVLIATDFSRASEKALCHARAIAQYYGAKLSVAHVVSSLGLTMAGPDAIVLAEEAVLRDAAQLEQELAATGAVTGLQHKIIVRQGEVWPELQDIIRQEHVDLVVIGTHGRHGVGKLLLGSVAEQVFRHADCRVLTVGPSAYQQARLDNTSVNRSFLFATDFGEASLLALPEAISFANQFAAKLVLLHVLPFVPPLSGSRWYTANDVIEMRENAHRDGLQRLQELTRNARLQAKADFVVESSASPISEKILDVAERFKVDVIIMGLHRSAHISMASHVPWTTAYEVVCGAGCPVLTMRSGCRGQTLFS